MTARDAYDAMAPHYDAFTAHHNYEASATDLERLALAAGLGGRRLLDVACGTGKSFEPFLRRGYDVTACDVSAGMLEHARAKAPEVRIERHDMRALPRLGEFDLVCLLDDAVNYLESAEELRLTFAGALRNLAPGGVVLFDANTLMAYRTFFATPSLVRAEGRVLVWDGRTSPELEAGGRSEAELLAFTRGEEEASWSFATSVHRQRHHPRAVVLAALAAAGFGWTAVHGMQLDGSVTDGFDELANSKVLYLAKAEGR